MSKGGSPMGGGGFGGQQGGFGGGFGGQQGGFGGYGMPQQQQGFGGFGGGFGGQQGFGGGFGGQQGGYGMPPQQQDFGGFGGGFNQMPQQQRGGFGGGFQPSRQRFNQMPQQQMGYGGGFGGQMQGFGGGYGMPQRRQQDMFTPQVSRLPPPEQDFGQSQLAAQDAAMRSLGMPTSNEVDYTDPRRGQSINIAQPPRPMTQPMPPQQAGSDAARLYEQFQSAQGMGGQPKRSQDDMFTPQPQTFPMEPVRDYDRPQTLPNPYAQQTRQEDPRMQAMRMMQRMRFGGGGGYDF